MSSSQQINPIFLFDNPRTCSQLLYRFFSSHPQLETTKAYQWLSPAATSGPDRIQLRVKRDEHAKASDESLQQKNRAIFGPLGMDFDNETYKAAADRLSGTVAANDGSDGKILVVKEHVACSFKPDIMDELLRTGSVAKPPANPTAIPDDIFAKIRRPVFLIRHPALVVESHWRAQHHFGFQPDDEGFQFFTTPRSTKLLFDALRDRDPIVIDAEDVVYRSEPLCEKLCEIWGIDRSGVQYSWEKAPEESDQPQHPGRPYFFGTLDKSTAPIRPAQKAVDVEAEYSEWKRKFGTDVADGLRRRANADMQDYEYLQQFRMQV